MKAVIDGKRYDTETATLIAHDAYGYPRDFSHWEEGLYKTSKGSWFTAGSGGPMTRYAVDLGNNSRGGGSEIFALTEEEALAWCEQHDVDADTIAAHFKIEDA